MIFYQ